MYKKFQFSHLISTLLILGFLFPFAASALSIPAGILKDQIWFSKDPFFAGDTITIFTFVFNSSDYRLSGTMVLTDGTTTIDKKTFTVLPSGGSQVVSFPWTVTRGQHNFSAKISENQLDKVTGGVVNTPISTIQTVSVKRFVDLDTNHDGTPDRKELHTLIKAAPLLPPTQAPILPANPIKTLEQSISDNAPLPVSSTAIPVIGFMEEIRVSQAKSANRSVLKAALNLASDAALQEGIGVATPISTSAWGVFTHGITSGEVAKSPLDHVKLFLALIWQLFTTNMYAFYALLLLVIYKAIRLVFQLFT